MVKVMNVVSLMSSISFDMLCAKKEANPKC